MSLVLLAGVLETMLQYETGQADVSPWTVYDLIYQKMILID